MKLPVKDVPKSGTIVMFLIRLLKAAFSACFIFKVIKKLNPSVNCSREKYCALKTNDEWPDSCGPCSLYCHPRFI